MFTDDSVSLSPSRLFELLMMLVAFTLCVTLMYLFYVVLLLHKLFVS